MGRINPQIDIGLSYLKSARPWLGDGKFDLSNVRQALLYLDNPQDVVRSVHIAGTNGKGSTSAAIASILGAAGFKVGLNISPHLLRINERVVIDGFSVGDDWLGEFSYDIMKASEKAFVTLSFHEAITCAAFLGFRESGLDWGVYEVGLGGIHDASNVLKRPVVACITSIDLDHQDILGETITLIAEKKAGIIKNGTPTVLGQVSKDAAEVFQKYCNQSNLFYFNSEYGAKDIQIDKAGRARFEFWNKSLENNLGKIDNALAGSHQVSNMSLAVKAGLEAGTSFSHCKEGISNVYWPARLESFVYGNKKIIIDSAHNPAGIQSLVQYLEFLQVEEYHLVFGVLETKSWREMFKLLRVKARSISLILPNSERALSNHFLIQEVSGTGIKITDYQRDYDKFLKELPEIENDLPVLICGSIYLVGQLRGLLNRPELPLWKRKE